MRDGMKMEHQNFQNFACQLVPHKVRSHLIRYIVEEGLLKKLPVAFYHTPSGAEPVRDWLKDLPPADRLKLGQDIGTVEFGWPVGMPLCRSLGDGLWEIRSDLSNNRTARVIFCVGEDRMVLLHGFIKKTQKTTKSDLELARKRQKDIEQ